MLGTPQYAYLLGLYLGDGCISATHRGVYCIRITLDAAYPGIIKAAKTARRGARRDCNCVEVSMYSKHWPCFFPQHGPGRKHLRPTEDSKRLFCDSCDAVGVRWTRPSDIQIAIYRKASVALLDEFVGPKR